MLIDIVAVKAFPDYSLELTFEDGAVGRLDLRELVDFKGVFGPLKDPDYFRQVAVDNESGTINWPNGADLDPDVLYSIVTGAPIPGPESFSKESAAEN